MGGEARVRPGGLSGWLRPALVAVALVAGLALAAVYPLLRGGQGDMALACGLGNSPTMDANNAPALLYPVTKNTPADQPIGIFTLHYVAGQPVTFIEDLSRVIGAPTLTSFKWRWDFGDGTGYSSDVSPKHTYAKAGTYNVHAQIYDDSTAAWTDIDSAQIQVIPAALSNPPVAKLTASTPVVAVNGQITFDASGSHAADGSQLTYQWNFNDGSTATGQKVTHTFAIQGQGLVALIVSDSRGARSVATTTVYIVSSLMQASETSANPGDTISFDATSALQQGLPPGDTHIQFTWNFGDGTQPQQTQAPTVSHSFTKSGQFAVQVQAVATDQKDFPPALAAVAVTVAAPQAVTHPGAQAGQNWALLGGGAAGVLAVLVLGFFLVQAQLRRNALIRERAAAMELARARSVRASRGARNAGMRPPRGPAGPYAGTPSGGARQGGRNQGPPRRGDGRPVQRPPDGGKRW
jgi:PKD repeat protein